MKKMWKIISLLLVLVGLILFSMGLYARHRVSSVKHSIDSGSALLPNNPFNKEFSKSLNEKISSYDLPIFLALAGGVVCVIGGVWLFIYGKKK